MRRSLDKTLKMHSLKQDLTFHKYVMFRNLHVAPVTNRNLGQNKYSQIGGRLCVGVHRRSISTILMFIFQSTDIREVRAIFQAIVIICKFRAFPAVLNLTNNAARGV